MFQKALFQKGRIHAFTLQAGQELATGTRSTRKECGGEGVGGGRGLAMRAEVHNVVCVCACVRAYMYVCLMVHSYVPFNVCVCVYV